MQRRCWRRGSDQCFYELETWGAQATSGGLASRAKLRLGGSCTFFYLSARRSELKAYKKEHCLELLNFSHRLCNDCRGSWEEKYGNNSDLMFLISVPEDDGEQNKTVLEISALAALL